ncbi:MAG: peptide deformylase [Firmicutes bacterium]|nr:peptide deformylase [Bacillota bacterium]
MAIRNIRTEGDPALAKVCRPVAKVDDHYREIIDDLVETMRSADGVGLAAPQVGILRRIVVVEVGDQLFELVNPEIVSEEGEQYGSEGCLSVPGYAGNVKRPMKVTVKALDRNGEPVEYTGEGLLARAFCHELDHLDGVLYTSKADDLHELTDEPEEEDGEAEE